MIEYGLFLFVFLFCAVLLATIAGEFAKGIGK